MRFIMRNEDNAARREKLRNHFARVDAESARVPLDASEFDRNVFDPPTLTCQPCGFRYGFPPSTSIYYLPEGWSRGYSETRPDLGRDMWLLCPTCTTESRRKLLEDQ